MQFERLPSLRFQAYYCTAFKTMSDFKIPPKLESHTFTGVAASGGGEDWLDIEGVPIDPAVNGFIFDKNDQKVLKTAM